MILAGRAEVETGDGRTLSLTPGDILVTPVGSKGTWRIEETLLKCFAIYEGGPTGDTEVQAFRRDEAREWIEVERPPGDEAEPGEEWVAFRSGDRRFSVGLWHGDPETGRMELTYDEVACLIEGEVDVRTDDDRVLSVGAGDVLVTPNGTSGLWQAKSRVEKLWAVHHE